MTYEYDAAGQLVSARRARYSRVRRLGPARARGGDGLDRAYRWDALGRLVEVGDTRVDGRRARRARRGRRHAAAVGQRRSAVAAGVDGRPRGDRIGQPWATARDGEAEWLAPDWQGTLGGPRDPFGAPLGPAEPGLRLGYRGELEFAGQTWLRARALRPRDPQLPLARPAAAGARARPTPPTPTTTPATTRSAASTRSACARSPTRSCARSATGWARTSSRATPTTSSRAR